MSSNTLVITRLSRLPKFSDGDELRLQKGVNVIVGEKDVGKTTWLKMLDYLMGSTDRPEEEFGEDPANRYQAVQATVRIGQEEFELERRWHEAGNRTKVFANGEAIHDEEFSEFLLTKLGIPLIHFPRGSPYADRGWPKLSWRMLLRHVYRQERFWGDFAERQLPSEQHACLAQFLGVAEILYPAKFGDLIQRQKELNKLQAQKESYTTLLHAIATELVSQRELSVAVTQESIKDSEDRLTQELGGLKHRREEILSAIKKRQKAETGARFLDMQEQRRNLAIQREELLDQRAKVTKRRSDLSQYVEVLNAELGRIARLKSSGQLLADLKVTQCPVCDQEITPDEGQDVCYLCARPLPRNDGDLGAALKRVGFEEDQMREEAAELHELIGQLTEEEKAVELELERTAATIRQLEGDLAPAQQLAEAMIPPDLSILDQEAGRIREQLEQLRRVRQALELQNELNEKIRALEVSEAQLSKEINEQLPAIDFAALSQTMEDGMNNYLNAINAGGLKRWDHGRISFAFRERDFQVRVKGRRWDTQIGATSQALVLFAYHYGLMSLVAASRFNYPGLVIIDFPVQLADGTSVADKENYLVEPFVKLCRDIEVQECQLIAASRAFEGLQGANRIIQAKMHSNDSNDD
jgi:energy-coupling factor transporter ATP-binding protein EcfA2